jgi:phospholipid-translocating ATPase
MSSTSPSPPKITPENSQTSSPRPSRPQLHIDTTPVAARPPIPSPSPRSRDGHRPSFNYDSYPPRSSSPSIRSQRSDQPRVRFSSDVQTLGERTMVSPSITADEALSRLQRSSSQSSLNRRAGSIPSELPHLSVASSQHDPIRGILRTPSKSSATPYTSATQHSQRQRQPNRPRGWSLKRQLWSKQDSVAPPLSVTEIGLSTLPTSQIASRSAEPRLSHSIEDVDAIRVVQSALDQAEVDPPVALIQPKSSTTKKIPAIEPEVTQASLPFYSTWAASRRTRHMLVRRCKELMRSIKRLRDPRLISKGKGREIPINIPERGRSYLIDDRTGREYVDNLITSSRYTVYSFLPRQLWAQFSKVANLYVHP